MQTIEITKQHSPWCSLSEAASYLGYQDGETVDALLTISETFVSGKIRHRVVRNGSKRRTLRLWKNDVFAMLPPFAD